MEEETEETEDEETETPEKMLEYNEADIVVFVVVANRLTDGLLIMIVHHYITIFVVYITMYMRDHYQCP